MKIITSIMQLLFVSSILSESAFAESTNSIFQVATFSESKIQAEACIQASEQNAELARHELESDSGIIKLNSNKKLTYTDNQTFVCEVDIVWGINSKKTRPMTTIPGQGLLDNLPSESVPIINDRLIAELSTTSSLQLSGGYEGLRSNSLILSYMAHESVQYRFLISSNVINYKFEENGKTVDSNTFESIGFGIEKRLLPINPIQIWASIDLIESFPFDEVLTITQNNQAIDKKVKSKNFIRLSVPSIKYRWKDYQLNASLSRNFQDSDARIHPYNYTFGASYIW
jgi:hypothetical protein